MNWIDTVEGEVQELYTQITDASLLSDLVKQSDNLRGDIWFKEEDCGSLGLTSL